MNLHNLRLVYVNHAKRSKPEQQDWYDRARTLIDSLYPDGTQRLAAMSLLDAARDVKLQKEPQATESWRWFNHPFREGMSLQLVSDILGLYIGDVQRRVRRMMAIDMQEAA